METLKRADALFELSKSNKLDDSTIPSTSLDLSADQLKSRDLFTFAIRSEEKSDLWQIYANIGFACLGIRRLLKACLPFFFFFFFTVLSNGSRAT